MFAVSGLSARYHSLNFSTKVAATVQPTRPQPETKEQRNKAGYEADDSDEDEFFDVSIVLTWLDTLHPYSDSPPLQVPGSPTGYLGPQSNTHERTNSFATPPSVEVGYSSFICQCHPHSSSSTDVCNVARN